MTVVDALGDRFCGFTLLGFLIYFCMLLGCDEPKQPPAPDTRCYSHVTIVGHSAGTPNEAWCGPGQAMRTTLTGETMFVVCECVDGGAR